MAAWGVGADAGAAVAVVKTIEAMRESDPIATVPILRHGRRLRSPVERADERPGVGVNGMVKGVSKGRGGVQVGHRVEMVGWRGGHIAAAPGPHQSRCSGLVRSMTPCGADPVSLAVARWRTRSASQ